MHHRRTDIHQQPLAGFFAFNTVNLAARRFDFFLHVARQRAAMAVGVTRGNDDFIEISGHFFDVEYHDIARFDVFQCVKRDPGDFIESHHGIKFSFKNNFLSLI